MTERINEINKVIQDGPFLDSFESLTQFEMPRWFEKAKFGIFVHWGLFSVPAYNNEWYSRNMYVKDSDEYNHHINTYGPHTEFGYKDFIPMFKAEKFDATEWINTFKEAGAKYIVPVAEHHDGFQMYKSDISHFNAFEMGPRKDIIGELKEAADKASITFATSTHRAEHFWFMGCGREFKSDITGDLKRGDFYWPSVANQPDQQDFKAEPYPTQEFLDDWLIRTCEIIDKYQPAILYFDWWVAHEGYQPTFMKIAAYYYNMGKKWNKEVAIAYKHDALPFGSGIVDVERGKFADAKPYHWQTDTAIAHNSWCYTTNLMYKTSYEIITYMIDVVAKNGNLLLNVGPKSDGSFAKEDADILKDIGSWLKVNGEAIYGSKPWRFAEEGPTKETEGQFAEGGDGSYTSQDFRFTSNNGCIYAICMKCPEDGHFAITRLAKQENKDKPNYYGFVNKVEILGYKEEISFTRDMEALKFNVPELKSDMPVVIKIQTQP